VFIVSFIVYSNCHILQFLHQNFQCVRLAAVGFMRPAIHVLDCKYPHYL